MKALKARIINRAQILLTLPPLRHRPITYCQRTSIAVYCAHGIMTSSKITYLNVGIYTVPEASKLTGVSRDRIRRWLRGYRSHLRKKRYSALWKSQLPEIDNKMALGFLDLIEVMFVGAFLDRGVSWPMIHRVREKAAKLYPEVSH